MNITCFVLSSFFLRAIISFRTKEKDLYTDIKGAFMLPETKNKWTVTFQKYYGKYKHLWILLYFFVYMAWFNYVEKTVTTHFPCAD